MKIKFFQHFDRLCQRLDPPMELEDFEEFKQLCVNLLFEIIDVRSKWETPEETVNMVIDDISESCSTCEEIEEYLINNIKVSSYLASL